MKNKRGLILFGTLFSVLVFFAPRVLAQEVPNPNISNVSQVKLITIATVNIYDARIISQDGNKIRIGFDLYNRTDIQPGIKYSVELVKTEGEGDDETQTIVDEKVYDEKIYLGADQTASKEIEYMAPEYLSGDFSIWITSKNDKGLGFGTSEAGKISLKGNGQYVEIVDNLCVLTVRGEDNKTQYYPDQGVDISKNEILLANCRVKNNFSASVNAVPNFSIYYRDTYGEKVSETKQSPINFSAGEEKIITLEIPKAEKPQAYDAVLSFFDEKEKNVSSQAVLHYVVQGQSATIQNLILDKDYYQKGDLAKLSVLWDSSADAFWGARGKGTKDNVYNLDILIKSALGETCSKENNIVLDSKKNGPQVFDVAITKECANPEVVLSIKNEKGVVMDSSKYQVGNAAVKKNNVENVKKLLYIFSSILFLLVVIYVLIKKKTKFKSIKNIIFVLVFAFFAFGFCLGAKADTYTLPQGFIGSTFEINLNKNNYEPGEIIKATTSVPYLRGCDNNVRHVTVNVSISGVGSATLLDGRYMQENCATTFPGMFGTICKKKAKGEASFSAQSVPGAYSADFSFYYYLNGAWDGGSASIPYKVKCRKPVSPTPSSNISPKIVGTGENFSVSCDYGVATNSVFATVGGGTCVFTGWSGTAAVFNCTAGSKPGTRNVKCIMKSITPDYYCAGVDLVGQINVIGNNAPVSAVEYPSEGIELEKGVSVLELKGKGTDPDGSIIKHQWFLKKCTTNPITGETVCNCNEDPDTGEASCTGSPKYFSDVNEAGVSYNVVNVGSLAADSEPYVFYYRVRDNDNKWSAFDKRSFKIIKKNELTVDINPKGAGTVTSSDGQINCSGGTTGCVGKYSDGDLVTLTAISGSGYKFKRWTIGGNPGGSNNPRTVTMNSNKSVVAVFEADSVCAPLSPDSQYCQDNASKYCRGTKFPEENCDSYVCEGSKDCTEWSETGP